MPLAMASDEERLAGKSFDRLEPYELAQLHRLMSRLRAGHAGAARAPPREGAPRRARQHAAHAARQPAHRRRSHPARAPAPARRPAPARDAVRHLGLHGALRARLPPVPGLRRRERPGGRGVLVRDPSDPPHPGAGVAPPGARDPARRRGRAGLVERHPDRRRAEGVQRPPRPPRGGPRRRGRDPVRRLGARRSGPRRARDGAPGAARPPHRLGEPARRRERVLGAGGRDGGRAAALRRAGERAQLRRPRRGRRGDRGALGGALGGPAPPPAAEAAEEEEAWASATPVPGSSVAMPSGYGPSRGRTTPGWGG